MCERFRRSPKCSDLEAPVPVLRAWVDAETARYILEQPAGTVGVPAEALEALLGPAVAVAVAACRAAHGQVDRAASPARPAAAGRRPAASGSIRCRGRRTSRAGARPRRWSRRMRELRKPRVSPAPLAWLAVARSGSRAIFAPSRTRCSHRQPDGPVRPGTAVTRRSIRRR
jgi:hypothetical protein